MKITEEHTTILNALLNLGIKLLLAISSVAAFWVILLHLLTTKDPVQACTLGALNLMLAGTIYYIVAHYFPSWKAAAAKNKKKSNKPSDPPDKP